PPPRRHARAAPHPLERHSFPTRRSSDLHPPEQQCRRPLEHRARRAPQKVRETDINHLLAPPDRQHQARISVKLDAETRRPAITTDRKSTRLNSSHVSISYAVFCLKKKSS